MKRRDFVKSSAALTLPFLLKSCQWSSSETTYPVNVQSDAKTGHLIRKSHNFTRVNSKSIETLIVGGGMAGMSAACALKGSDFLLCELSTSLGGTSSAHKSRTLEYAQGAHYDLAYPSNYGAEVLALFEKLNIIKYQPWNDRWGFVDEQYLITHRRKNQCYDLGEMRPDVLAKGPSKSSFLDLLSTYQNVMPLPTRLIGAEFRHLNQLTFADFLSDRLNADSDFLRGVSYHMKDDYGADAFSVSALAGILYFMCRPYYNEIVELFSPPEGNHYFIRKMANYVGKEQLLTEHLVSKIMASNRGFKVEVIDVAGQQMKQLEVKKIIYAGQKHALKYVFPSDAALFAGNKYAPWMVVNVIIRNELSQIGYWQNEMLTEDPTFLGFIDSDAQERNGQYRIFTAYYCLPPSSRNDLMNTEANKANIAKNTIDYISSYFNTDISEWVKEVNIKVMGHSMPIPEKGYLFDDKNQHRSNERIAYAGVDNSRLPLLFEAVDSGLAAVGMVGGV